jgi:hypothetical protein
LARRTSRSRSSEPILAHGAVHNGNDACGGVAKVRDERRLDQKLLALSKLQLLFIDEIDYLPLEADAAHLLYSCSASATNLRDADRSASRAARNRGLA